MRSTCAIAAWALLLDMALAPASAQEWFSLAKSDRLDGQVMDGTRCRWLPRTEGRPLGLKGVPARLGKTPAFFAVTVNGRRAWLVVGSPPAERLPKAPSPLELIADANQNGDFSDEVPVLPLRLAGDVAAQGRRVESFGPVVFRAEGMAEGPGVELIFSYFGSKGMAAYSAFDREGDVRVDGVDYHLALSDHNADGRYDGFFPGAGDSAAKANPRTAAFSEHDKWSVLPKHDGLAAEQVSDDESADLVPMTRFIALHGKYYYVELKPDGSAIRLFEANPPMGVLDVGSPDISLTLFSEYGRLVLRDGGRWSVPAGRYTCWAARFEDADGGRTARAVHGSRDFGKLKEFVIRPGKTLSLRFGSALKSRIASRQGRATKGGTIEINPNMDNNRVVDRYALAGYDRAVDLSAGRVPWRAAPPRLVVRKVGYG